MCGFHFSVIWCPALQHPRQAPAGCPPTAFVCSLVSSLGSLGSSGRLEVRGERRSEEGRGGGGMFCSLSLSSPEPLSRHIKFLPSLPGCPALALGISLVYMAHYAHSAVAIATTRGQFIEEEEVHFWGVSFPASVQSRAENKDPDTGEETHGKVLGRAEASFRASDCTQRSFFFALTAVLESPIGAWRSYPCISQIFLFPLCAPPCLALEAVVRS